MSKKSELNKKSKFDKVSKSHVTEPKEIKSQEIKPQILKAVLTLEALVNMKCLLTVCMNNVLSLLTDYGIKTEDLTNGTCQSTKNRRKS